MLNIVLARLLGPQDAGLYFLSITCVTIAAVVGRFGLDDTVVRFIGVSLNRKNKEAIKGIYYIALVTVLFFSCIMSLFLFFMSTYLSEKLFSKPELADLMRAMSLSVVPISVYTIHAQVLQGMKKIKDAIFTLSVSMPLFTLLGILFLVPRKGLYGAGIAYNGAALITLIIGVYLFKTRAKMLKPFSGSFSKRVVFQSSLPLFWMMLFQLVILWSSSIMIGMFMDNESVALFNVANRTSSLISFFLVAVNSISAPKYAEVYSNGEIQELERISNEIAKRIAIAASPILIFFLVCPSFIMSFFGSAFREASMSFCILTIGQYLNVITGSVAYLLIMSGNESSMRNIMAICTVLCIVLNYYLIPIFGIEGASLATALTLIFLNILAIISVWQHLKIMPFPLISMFLKKNRR